MSDDTNGAPTIRDARDDERAAIRELTLAAYAEYATLMRPSAWAALHEVLLAALSSEEPVTRIVAEQGGALVGSVMLYFPEADAYGGVAARGSHPEIRLLAVRPEARGRGVGAALLRECVRRARESGAQAVGLHSSASMRAAIGMYERMGFVREPEGDFQPPGAELVMAYRLPLSSDARARAWPQSRFPGILFGADYNPEQWTPAMGYAGESVWLEDMRLMRAAGVNIATVGVFSWAALEPEEGRFSFEWMDRLLDLLAQNGIRACLGTATAAQPAWLSQAYPDVLPVDERGQRLRHGGRMRFCPTSPDFRRRAQILVRALAERYGGHPALLIWHVSNEYGPHCFCERCAARFRDWLRARYGTLEALNAAWVTPFWSHTFTDWSQIEPPLLIGERGMQGHMLDYQRFMSDMNLECYQGEAAVLRELTPGVPVMTNFHGLIKGLDYAAWAPHVDIVAWDSYPTKGEPAANVAFRHALMRGLRGGQPWLLLEQTPSQTQWRPYNPLKRPGEMRLQSYQALAHGADSVMFFQWRQSRGSSEMHHGAIVSHAGTERTRVFQEVAALGAELASLGTQTLGARVPARAALLFSWPSWWAVEYRPGLSAGLSYMEEATRMFAALWAHNIAVDVISPDAPLDGYRLVVAPLLHMVTERQAEAIERFVAGGGTFLTTFFSGIVGEDGRAWLGGSPGPLRRTLGVWVEEVDPLLPGEANGVRAADAGAALDGACDLWCELLHLEGARSLATFSADFYAGRPAVTEHRFGAGRAYYVATRLEPALLKRLLGALAEEAGVRPPLAAPEGVEVVERRGEGGSFTFVLNHGAEEQAVALPHPMRDLLGGAVREGELRLAGRGVAILVDAGSAT